MSNAIDIKIDDRVFKRALSETPYKTVRFFKKTMEQSALFIQNDAKALAPYDTGQLRRSITNKTDVLSAQIGSNLVYAPIQEFGGKAGKHRSVYIKGKPYLRPSLKKNKRKILKKFASLAKAVGLKK